jgi:hypothetical protein
MLGLLRSAGPLSGSERRAVCGVRLPCDDVAEASSDGDDLTEVDTEVGTALVGGDGKG